MLNGALPRRAALHRFRPAAVAKLKTGY